MSDSDDARDTLVRCPDCTFAKVMRHARAKSHQHSHDCPNCSRGLATQPLAAASESLLSRYSLGTDEQLYAAVKASA